MELADEFKSKYELKTPKGTRDFGPEQMAIREKVLGIMTETFKRHGAATIETPVFELREVLMGKYGEEGSKLVYDLADQGGELCSLRYDLTVPFARYLAANKIEKIKRYQIAKVYRRDQPVMTKGRYREFYQCDFDIAGQGELMMQEAECLKIVEEVLTKLDVGEFEIRINHRLLLDGMFAASGVAEHLFKTVSSSVDKLDKQPWAEVREELERDKHVEEDTVHRLGELNIRQGVDELKLLFQYTELFGCNQSRIVFQPSLARGLDYYTGVIFEVVLKEFSFNSNVASTNKRSPQKKTNLATEENSETESSGSAILGSVAAGGRYDKLVGMFTDMGRGERDGGREGSAKKRPDVPCVGVSFGIERLFTVMEMKAHADTERTVRVSPTQVYVTSASATKDISAIMLQERMRLCGRLWDAGIRAETSQNWWLLILGAKELAENSVKLRCIPTREEEVELNVRMESDIPFFKLVKMEEIIDVLREKLKVD
uniref:histidine--tRNA ligase n=1 Tax=Globodera pallida TaxID=36090 RepID=A0A183C2B5_GLOPA